MSTRTPRSAFRRLITATLTAVLAVSLLQVPEATAAEPKPTPTAEATAKPKAKPKPAAAAAACNGSIVLDTVKSCDAIGAGQTDTFTLTTTRADESILMIYRDTGESGSGNLSVNLTGEGVSCNIYGFSRCELPTAGTYTATVENYSDSPGSYTLSATSIMHSPCTALSGADLSPTAAPHYADLPRGLVANCFNFSAAAGDVLRYGDAVDLAMVYDATGTEVCSTLTSRPCTVSGQAPYRSLVTSIHRADDSKSRYAFALARMNDPIGCPAMSLSPFGGAEGSTVTGSMLPGTMSCRSITASSGRLSVRLETENNSSSIHTELYTPEGQQIGCGDPCSIPADGTYTILLSSDSNDYSGDETNRYDLAITDLTTLAGCAPEIEPRWDTSAPLRTKAVPVQLDCQPIKGSAGDRILVQLRGETGSAKGTSQIVDPTGQSACSRDSHDGCVLEGEGPFRVLTIRYPGSDDPYRLDIGRLSDPVGCVPIGISDFGAPAPLAPNGSRCRELTVTAPTTYTIDPRTAADSNYSRGAYDTQGIEHCANLTYCELEPGKYTVIAPADRRVAIFPRTSTAGCTAQPADTFAAISGYLADESQYDCLGLQAPAGARIALTEPVGQRVTEGSVLDAAGTQVCSWGWWTDPAVTTCELTGTAPFRALVHQRTVRPAGHEYRLVIPRTDQLTGCQVLPQSDFSAPGGLVVALRPERFAACLAVPADGHSAAETLEHVRTGSVGSATAMAFTMDSTQRCDGREGPAWFDFCDYEAGKAVQVLVVGSADTASHRISRRDMTSTARGCTPVMATTIGGISGSGALPDSSVVRCFKVTGAATDRFAVNVRSAQDGIPASVFRPNGDYACKTYSETRCEATGSAGYQVMVFNDPNVGPAGAFTLEVYRVSGVSGPAPECTRVDSAYGFGPLTGELSNSKRTACVAIPMAKHKTLNGHARNQVANTTVPIFTPYPGTNTADTCSSYAGEDGRFDCYGYTKDAWTQIVLLSLPEEPAVTSLKYLMTADCEAPLCGGATFGVTAVAPTSAAAGAPATVTVRGRSLHLKDVVKFKATGKPDLLGVVKSVSADRTAATVAVDLKGAAVGARSLVVDSFAGGSATVANGFTVTPQALVNTKAPALVAPVRVGTAVKVAVGTWSPVATSYTYQWRDNGAAIRGAGAATYTPGAALLGHKLSVTVTAARAGYASKAVTTAAVAVATGLAPKAVKGPVVTGTYKVGKTVTSSAGTWAPACTAVRFQWYSAGKAVVGGTKASLVLTKAMGTKALYVAVTCARTGHASGVASTRPVTVAV